MSTDSQSEIKEILEARGSKYGSFDMHALITQSIKIAMKNTKRWNDLNPAQKECLEMVAHKIGRILNGDPYYLDSWVDIIGYTQLVVDDIKLRDKERRIPDGFSIE